MEQGRLERTEFLAGMENGKTTREYLDKQVVFSQGDAADAVFYLQSGKVQLYFMNRFRKMGFIHYDGYNGGLQVHSALLTVVLRD